MARPVNADAEATRRKVLGAASLLFAEHGVDGVSVRDVARDAGVSLGLVHHYFGSKDALYQAAIAAMYAELDPLRAEFDRALAEGGDLAALIERVVRAGFGFACAHRSEIKLMMRTVVDTGEVDARWREAQQLPFLEQTSALLARLLARPAAELRLVIQSLNHLVIRYALTAPRELALVAGEDPARSSPPGTQAVAAVEDHLVAVALRLLDLHRPTTAAPAPATAA